MEAIITSIETDRCGEFPWVYCAAVVGSYPPSVRITVGDFRKTVRSFLRKDVNNRKTSATRYVLLTHVKAERLGRATLGRDAVLEAVSVPYVVLAKFNGAPLKVTELESLVGAMISKLAVLLRSPLIAKTPLLTATERSK